MNTPEWALALLLFNTLGTLVSGAYSWYAARSKATKASIDRVERVAADAVNRVEGEVRALAGRVEHMDGDLRHMPSKSDIEKLHEKINTVTSGQSDMGGTLRAMTRQLDLIQQSLLEGRT